MEKERRVEVLRALLEMHEQQNELDDEYIKGLRQRLKRRRHNLRTCVAQQRKDLQAAIAHERQEMEAAVAQLKE